MSKCPEDVAFAATKVGVDLAGQKGVLGNVSLPGVVVEWKQEEPDGADDDAKEGQVGRDLEHARVAP